VSRRSRAGVGHYWRARQVKMGGYDVPGRSADCRLIRSDVAWVPQTRLADELHTSSHCSVWAPFKSRVVDVQVTSPKVWINVAVLYYQEKQRKV